MMSSNHDKVSSLADMFAVTSADKEHTKHTANQRIPHPKRPSTDILQHLL